MKTIYALCDPFSGEARYIGLTAGTVAKRLERHLEGARRRPDRELSKWLLYLKSLGIKPDVRILETTDDASMEAQWIKRYTESGCNLLNATPSGIGTTNGLSSGYPRALREAAK